MEPDLLGWSDLNLAVVTKETKTVRTTRKFSSVKLFTEVEGGAGVTGGAEELGKSGNNFSKAYPSPNGFLRPSMRK